MTTNRLGTNTANQELSDLKRRLMFVLLQLLYFVLDHIFLFRV